MKRRPDDSDRLRIAHVVPQLDMGGMERLLVEFGRHSDRSRFSLLFISLTDRGDLTSDLEDLDWPVTHLEMPPGLRPSAVWQLCRGFRDAGIDVVHTHNNKSLIYAAPAARLAGIRRIIHTRHGQNFSCSAREMFVMRSLAHLVSQFVAVSEDSAQRAIENGFSRAKVMHIRNGIDLSRFPFSGPVSGGPVVMVGRLGPEKNVQVLLRAAAILNRRSVRLNLEIAGDGPCRRDLERLSAELGLTDQVRFLGQIHTVQQLLSRASVLVLPSLTEGVSLALLEAMAIGLPIVATRVGGNPEVVDDGQTGLLVPPDDADAVADAVLRITADRPAQQAMSRAARARVETLFDVTHMVSSYEHLYEGNATLPAARPLRPAQLAAG